MFIYTPVYIQYTYVTAIANDIAIRRPTHLPNRDLTRMPARCVVPRRATRLATGRD